MRLTCEPRLENTDANYKVLKVAILALEQYGHFSTNFLGAYALLALHEIGQGILPAAWLTINGLVGLLCALGIHDKIKAVQVLQRPGKARLPTLLQHRSF